MCRIAGYLGVPQPLNALLAAPPRSLRQQAKAPRELPPGVVGSDGFGVGWFVPGHALPARFRSLLPIWVDENVDTLAEHVRSSVIVASSRTASRRMPVAIANTPPFLAGSALLAHNGEIADFPHTALDALRAELSPSVRADIIGNTDSEYLAAILRERPEQTLVDRVRSMLQIVRRHVEASQTAAQLNLIIAAESELVVLRYATAAAAPSLYVKQLPNGLIAASEPMDETPGWRGLAPGQMVTATGGQAAPRVEWTDVEGGRDDRGPHAP
jgi:glutamine amidotransferase